jgi:hypothetical protein
MKTKAQEASLKEKITTPIPVEATIGNNRFGLQFLLNRDFPNSSHVGFLAVTSYASDYKNNLNNLDFISNAQVSYKLGKGIGVALGTSVNAKTGLVTVAALEYIFANREILFVITPNIHISDSYNLEGLTVLEYKPALSKKINLYSRFQSLYNHNTKENFHERSYVQLRLGLGIKNYQFGLAYNADYYGPTKILKDNTGVFVRVNF